MASNPSDINGSDAADYLRTISVAVGLAVAGFLVANLLLIPLLITFSFLEITLQSTIGFVAVTIVQAIAFVLVVIAYMRYTGLPDLLNIRWPSIENAGRTLLDAGWVIVGFIVLLIASSVIGFVLQQFGFAPGTNQIVRAVRQNPTLALYLIVLSFVVVGPGEETLFRGGIQGVLRRTFSSVPAVVISSALFGFAHVTSVVTASGAGGVWGYVVSAFLLGLVLGSIYEYTDNLLIPILVHGAYNAILFTQLYIMETGSALGFLTV